MKQDTVIRKINIIITLMVTLGAGAHPAWAESPKPDPQGEIGVIGGSVSRSSFTLAVVNHEPREPIQTLSNDQRYIYYFTELKGMAGRTVKHRWLYKGENMAEVTFDVGAARWRVWSTKTLQPHQLGQWTVQVVDDLDRVVSEESFEYVEAETKATSSKTSSAAP